MGHAAFLRWLTNDRLVDRANHGLGPAYDTLDVVSGTESVISSKVKLSGVTRFHRATVITTGPEGSWLFSPAGTVVSGPDGRVGTQPADGVQFFPAQTLPESGGWYVAWCWAVAAEPASEYWSRRWISVDIAAPLDGRFSFLDLELDLWCNDAETGIVDQEDLDAVEAAGQLNPRKAATARLAADELHQHLRDGCRDAFGGVGWALLEQAHGRHAHRA